MVDALRVAGGDGRLSAEELDTRLERALSARTLGELAGLTTDLPNAPAAKEVLVIRQHAGRYDREGRWLVPARIWRTWRWKGFPGSAGGSGPRPGRGPVGRAPALGEVLRDGSGRCSGPPLSVV